MPYCGFWSPAPSDGTQTVMVPLYIPHTSSGSGTLAVDATAWARIDTASGHNNTVDARIVAWSQDGALTCLTSPTSWGEAEGKVTKVLPGSCVGFVPAAQIAFVQFNAQYYGNQTPAQRYRIYSAAYTFAF
jgi:hypothetical protein